MASPGVGDVVHKASLNVAVAASRAESVEQVLSQVVREGAELIGVERCGVYMKEDHEQVFRALTACQGGHAVEEDVRRWRAGVPADGLTSEAVRTRRPVIVANARQDSRMIKAAVRRWDIRSIMAVPMVFEDEVLGLLLMDDVARRREFSDREAEAAGNFAALAAATVSQARQRLALRGELEVSRRHMAAERSAAAVSRSLTELVGRGRPLEELLDALAETLAKPCALYRNDGRRGPIAVPPGADAASIPAALGPDFEALLAATPQARGAREASHDGAVVVGPLPAARLPRRLLIVPLALGPEHWGHLAVVEDGPRLGPGDLAVARRAATLIALKGRLDTTAEQGTRDGRSLLAMEMMRGVADPEALQRRAGRLGFALDARRVVLAIGPRDPAGAQPDPARVSAALRAELPDLEVDVAAVGEAAAALIEVPRGEDPQRFVDDHADAFAAVCARSGGEDLVAGLSEAHRWGDGYRAARVEAMRVLACLRRFSPAGGPVLLTAAELGGGGLLLAGTAGDDIVRYAEETVGRLVDDPGSVDLVVTLCAFFTNRCSIRGTAAALGVHENTVRYRLGRVEEGTGLPVSREPDAQLSAHLGLVVMQLQGRLPAAALAARRGALVETDQGD